VGTLRHSAGLPTGVQLRLSGAEKGGDALGATVDEGHTGASWESPVRLYPAVVATAGPQIVGKGLGGRVLVTSGTWTQPGCSTRTDVSVPISTKMGAIVVLKGGPASCAT
jgi:hypothetical protein